jgi:hypothetical protein
MAKGGYGLTKAPPGPAMSYPSMPCGLATSETALWLFHGWPGYRAGSLHLLSTPYENFLSVYKFFSLPKIFLGL